MSGTNGAGTVAVGQPFYKLTGSGNDFVFFDERTEPAGGRWTASAVRALCARGTGVGADGVVWLEPGEGAADLRIRYVNADGSPAALCGNATLCTVRLSALLGGPAEIAIGTDAGIVAGRLREDDPEIDLDRVTGLVPDIAVSRPPVAHRIGYAVVGVPHLVVLVDDVAAVDVMRVGGALRRDPAVGPAGANVNFVGPADGGGLRMRTFERGVEGETLACGTGAVATAALLVQWGLALSPVPLLTPSGSVLTVRLAQRGGTLAPSLSGEGRLVYRGFLSGQLP